jgi:hypothetical protein
MSVKALTWAFDQVTELPVDKLVLLALADYANDAHECWPSRRVLASRAMCSTDTVDRVLKRLQVLGCIKKELRLSDRAGKTSSMYTLVGMKGDTQQDVAPRPQIAATPSNKTLAASLPPPLAADCGHPSRNDAATLAAQDAATGTTTEPSVESKKSCRLATTEGTGEAFEAFRLYNLTAQRIGLPTARSLTPQRKRSLDARLREHGLDGWMTAMANLAASKHCRGENDRGWRADFEFCLQAKSLARLIEGAYGMAAQNLAKPTDPDPVNGVKWGWWRPKAETYRAWSTDEWEKALERYPPNGTWPWWQIGPPPGNPECLVPPSIVERNNWADVYRGQITH